MFDELSLEISPRAPLAVAKLFRPRRLPKSAREAIWEPFLRCPRAIPPLENAIWAAELGTREAIPASLLSAPVGARFLGL